jgi:voltage-gated potassium channel
MMLFNFKVFRELYYSLLFLVITLVSGTLGYIYIEDYSFVDAVYMTVITVSTVGFGEVNELSSVGRLFTSILIIFTFGTFAFAVGSITRYLVSGDYRLYFKNYKVLSQLEKLNNHVIICGYGRNGKQAVKTLRAHGLDFVVIEGDQDVVEKIRIEDPNIIIVHGDATDDATIQKVQVQKARALITTLPKDADNLFVVLTARELSKSLLIISRASDDRSESKLRIAGANNVILPDKVGGSHMASLVTSPDLMEFLDHISMMGPDETTLVEVQFKNLPKDFAHKTIREIEKKYQTGSRIIGFKTPQNSIIVNPSPDTELVSDSKLFVLGNASQIKKLKSVLNIDAES